MRLHVVHDSLDLPGIQQVQAEVAGRIGKAKATCGMDRMPGVLLFVPM